MSGEQAILDKEAPDQLKINNYHFVV